MCLELWTADTRDAQRRFWALRVAATLVTRPLVDVADVRRRLDLTQTEFAMRFGFEPDTIRNLEQGRNNPDPAMPVFLAVIQRSPHIVDEVMTSGLSETNPATRMFETGPISNR